MSDRPVHRVWWRTLHPAGRIAVIGFVTAVIWMAYLLIAYPTPPTAELSTVIVLALGMGGIYCLARFGVFDA